MSMSVTVSAVIVVLLSAAVAHADAFSELNVMRVPPKAAPEFSVPALPTGTLRLGDFQGTVVFLNFWATWCPPCKQEMPSMERLYRRYKDRGFTILAVSIDAGDGQVVADFVTRLGLTFPIGLDATSSVAERYGLRALPSSFFIDRTGIVAGVVLGPRDWDGNAAHAVIETLIKQGNQERPN
jgi:peroxiredoxin